jgi:hypothetical protein
VWEKGQFYISVKALKKRTKIEMERMLWFFGKDISVTMLKKVLAVSF